MTANLNPNAKIDGSRGDTLRAWIEKSDGQLRLLMNEDVSGFNQLLKAHHLSVIQQ